MTSPLNRTLTIIGSTDGSVSKSTSAAQLSRVYPTWAELLTSNSYIGWELENEATTFPCMPEQDSNIN